MNLLKRLKDSISMIFIVIPFALLIIVMSKKAENPEKSILEIIYQIKNESR